MTDHLEALYLGKSLKDSVLLMVAFGESLKEIIVFLEGHLPETLALQVHLAGVKDVHLLLLQYEEFLIPVYLPHCWKWDLLLVKLEARCKF